MGQIGNVLKPESIKNMNEYAYIRNQIVPIQEANINIMTQAFLFGTAIYEGMRGYYNAEEDQLYIFRMKDHYERMCKNAAILKLNSYATPDELCKITKAVIRKNNFKGDCYIRPILYKSAIQYGLILENINDFALFCVLQGRFNNEKNKLNVCVSSWRRVKDNAIPARGKINGAYVNSCLAMTEAQDNGFDDAIFLTEDGHVAEGSGMNIFMVKKGVVYTPPSTDSILEGITRDTIFSILKKELNIEYEIRSIDRTELYTADELFFAGTAIEVISIHSVDHRIVGNGKFDITERIQKTFFDIVRGKNEKYSEWLEPIY